MEQCSPLGWIYYPEEAEMIELKRFLVQTTMELDSTILAAQDEMSRKEEELSHMRELLMVAIKERDEALHKCQKLLVEKNSLQQQLQVQHKLQKSVSLVAKDTKSNSNNSLTSSESEESIISEPKPQLATPSSSTISSSLPPNLAATLGKQRALPEKGRLLQAVMEAGPLLQTLLLAGPLPQWQHPPPPLNTIEIPPVTIPPMTRSINGCLVNTKNKRGVDSLDGFVSASPNCPKYQRVV